MKKKKHKCEYPKEKGDEYVNCGKKAKYECEECLSKYCEECADNILYACMNCPPPELVKINP